MKLWKRGLIQVCLLGLSLYLSYYCFLLQVQIFCVQPSEWGTLVWCSGAAGTFFPLPKESGYLTVITPSYSVLDYVIYMVVISTNLIYLLVAGAWLVNIIFAYKYLYQPLYLTRTENV